MSAQSSSLGVQKPVPVFFFRKRADIVFAEDAVAVAGNDVVSPVAQRFGQGSQEKAYSAPESSQFSEHGDDGIGAGGGALAGFFYEVHRIQIVRVETVLPQDSGGEVALQRGETEVGVEIAFQDELYEAVAEAADAVIKEDRIGGISHGGAN